MTRHLKSKTLASLRREGDVWECPGCGADNIYSITYVDGRRNPILHPAYTHEED